MDSPAATLTERTTEDDIVIMTDPDDSLLSGKGKSGSGRDRRRWLLPALPWTWFIVRDLHSVFEGAAIILPVVLLSAIVILILAATYRRSLLGVSIVLSLILLLVAVVALPRRPVSSVAPEESSRFASLNLARRWFSSNDIRFLVFDGEVDVFVGTELSESHDRELRDRYQFAASDLFELPPEPTPVGGVPDLEGTYREDDAPSIGLYSNYEFELLEDPIASEVAGGLPGFRVLMQLPEGETIVYALELPRPAITAGVYSIDLGQQADLVHAIRDAIADEEHPVVVLGDLSLTDRGGLYRDLTSDLTDAMRVDGWAPSTRSGEVLHSLLQLRIDYLLISPELCAIDPLAPSVFFTDHRLIQADIGPCPNQ